MDIILVKGGNILRRASKINTNLERLGKEEENTGEFSLLEKLCSVYTIAPFDYSHTRSATEYTKEDLEISIARYFELCKKEVIKPTPASLALYLGIKKSLLVAWRNFPEKFWQSEIVERAFLFMEAYLENTIDDCPAASSFLLKTTHGHIEESKMTVRAAPSDADSNESILKSLRDGGFLED